MRRARTNKPSRDVQTLSVLEASKLLEGIDAGPSEWYLYTWLVSLASAKRQETIRTTITAIRSGVDTPVGRCEPIKMALNTVKTTLDRLERVGLIGIERAREGTTVHLDITFH